MICLARHGDFAAVSSTVRVDGYNDLRKIYRVIEKKWPTNYGNYNTFEHSAWNDSQIRFLVGAILSSVMRNEVKKVLRLS